MIVKRGNEYINTEHIVLANTDEHRIHLVNGMNFRLDDDVFDKLLEIWIADETWAGVRYKEINVDHSTTISVSEVREQC